MGIKLIFDNGDWMCDSCGMRNNTLLPVCSLCGKGKEERQMIRMSLSSAVASLLGKKDHEDYRDVGKTLLAKDLYTLLGLTNSPMLYKYMNNKDSKIDPERAKVFLDKFDILIDIWLTPDELVRDCTNAEAGRAIAYQPIKELIDEVVEIDSIQDNVQLRRRLKLLIAKWY